ncbi:MAG: hypothetical protein QXF86_03190 [Candidatus Bilamarchaeaceae archaeon]
MPRLITFEYLGRHWTFLEKEDGLIEDPYISSDEDASLLLAREDILEYNDKNVYIANDDSDMGFDVAPIVKIEEEDAG